MCEISMPDAVRCRYICDVEMLYLWQWNYGPLYEGLVKQGGLPEPCGAVLQHLLCVCAHNVCARTTNVALVHTGAGAHTMYAHAPTAATTNP